MKTKILLLFTVLIGTALLYAEKPAGPKGGRLFETTPLKTEFFVAPDRHAEITFYDDHANQVLPGEQVVTVTAEPAQGRVPVELGKTSEGFRSKQPIPAGDAYRIVVQVRAAPGAKPQNFRLDLNLAPCGECKRAEYACICEGH